MTVTKWLSRVGCYITSWIGAAIPGTNPWNNFIKHYIVTCAHSKRKRCTRLRCMNRQVQETIRDANSTGRSRMTLQRMLSSAHDCMDRNSRYSPYLVRERYDCSYCYSVTSEAVFCHWKETEVEKRKERRMSSFFVFS